MYIKHNLKKNFTTHTKQHNELHVGMGGEENDTLCDSYMITMF